MAASTTQFASALACSLLAGACGAHASYDPIPETSERVVETPSALAVLAQGTAFSGLPAEITFGDPRGPSALFLQFPAEWRAHGAPRKAYLALEPLAGQATEAEPVRVEAWRVRSGWRAKDLQRWSDKPELAPPYASATTSSSPARPLRVDVTALLRFAADHPDLDRGIALISWSGSGHGASFTTGISGGAAPQLEVYLR
jgi:hypothetical protein